MHSCVIRLSCVILSLGMLQQACGQKVDVGLVNIPSFHMEVVCGFVHVLAPYVPPLHVYLHEYNLGPNTADGSGGFGFRDWIGPNRTDVIIRPVPKRFNESYPHHDVLIFVSPEYNPEHVLDFVESSNPKLVILLCHEGCQAIARVGLQRFGANGRRVEIMALAPHVCAYVSHILDRQVYWALPIIPLVPRRVCAFEKDFLRGLAVVDDDCLSGFTIQGQILSMRRNYTHLWQAIESRWEDISNEPRFKLILLGSGNLTKVNVTSRARRIVTVKRLLYSDFYNVLHDSIALLPLLGDRAYYNQKFTSSFISSFAAGVPVLIDRNVFNAYDFLHTDRFDQPFYSILEGESIIDAMLRVARMPSVYHASVRRALVQLRDRILLRTRVTLIGLITSTAQSGRRLLADHMLFDPVKGWCNSTVCSQTRSNWQYM